MIINDPHSKEQIAIVVVGYNRLKSITRLLNSLLNAHYPEKPVPLVISIDCSGDETLYHYVRNFNWPFGEKYVNIQKERLGLKQHIFQCGDLTRFFKAVVLLEDDLCVSPYFYEYVEKTVDTYGEEDEIAEISLYKNETNGYANLPFINLQDGCDVFLMQDVSTWGQCWTEQMWNKFVSWNSNHTDDDIRNVDMPERIKNWERAWSKYYNAYVVDTGKHVLYPNISLTTNFSDAGEHGGTNNSIVQVNLLQGRKRYELRHLHELIKYDIYGNNESIYDWLGIDVDDVCLDLYGIHRDRSKKFLISTKKYSYKIIDSFALNMRPLELNIKYNIKGEGIYLYDTAEGTGNDNDYSINLVPYLLGAFNSGLLLKHVISVYKNKIIRKITK